MQHMKTYTLVEANAHLDALAANPDFTASVAAFRQLITDGLPVDEIGFMMRGNIPRQLIEVLVEAHAVASEPIIAA
jgi:hypothetical protein